ncbi:MAG: cytochrome C biogenesis protein [Ardenticatenales bacterium]|nr:cytochrome C biogenesis protein [Ardenticatenales bacterium]
MEELLAAFTAGFLATTSPCVFPLYPGFLAYLSGQSQRKEPVSPLVLGVLVFLGVLSMMLLLGALIAAISVAVAGVVVWVTPLAYLLIIVLGLLLLFQRNPFIAFSQVRAPVVQNPYANAFVYGLLYGPIAFPCSGPLLVFIFAESLTTTDLVQQLGLFFVFGLGFGLPLLLLALLGQSQQQRIVRLVATHHRWVNVVAGLLLVGVGLYGFWQEWEILSLYLSQRERIE